MAHLPIRKKPEPTQAIQMMPMAVVLAIGVGVTFAFEWARKPPQEVAHALKQEVVQEVVPLAQSGLERLRDSRVEARMQQAATRSFEVDGKAWVLASHPIVTAFKPEEMQFHEEIDGWTLVANKVRGLEDLNPKAHAYDRLYLDLGNARYAPMRWRNVPVRL